MNLHIREAAESDCERLASAAGKIFYETFVESMPLGDLELYIETAFKPEHVLNEMNDPGNMFFLALSDSQIVGYAKLNTSRPPESLAKQKVIELERLYVFKKFHGKKIGAQLMQYAIDSSITNGYDVMWLAVWEKNPDAIAFYKRWEFEQFGAETFMRGNDPQTGLLFRRTLQ